MKKIQLSLLILLLISVWACGNKEEADLLEIDAIYPQEDYKEVESGNYKEFYGGSRQLKMEGVLDKDGQRHGVWTYYTSSGQKQSITEYRHGKKHGYSIVYHPNGALYYRGEWNDDRQVGMWDYYDPITGTKIETRDYGR